MRLERLTGVPFIVLLMLMQGVAFTLASVTASPSRIVPSEETLGIFDFIEGLSSGSVVVHSLDYPPSAVPELQPQAEAVLFHCKQKGLRNVIVAFWPQGAPLSLTAARKVYGDAFPSVPEYGQDLDGGVVLIGYIPGGSIGMSSFASDVWATIGVDHFGTPFTDLPLMDRVRNATDFGFWMDFTVGTPGAVQAIMYVSGPYGVPVGAGATAVAVPELMPYYNAGQLVGVLKGLAGATEYEYLLLLHYTYEPSLVPYLLGVKVGVWVEYGDFVTTWESEDPSASPPQTLIDANNTLWSRNIVQLVSGVNVTFQTIIHYENDTEQTIMRSLNVDSGDGNGTFWFILTCMEPSDMIYTNNGYPVNETTSRTYASFTRDVNHLSITQISATHNSSENLYWDKITGTLTEWTVQESLLDNGYITSWSTSFKMVDTNLWKTINVPTDYPTIQEAVDEAVPGDTVRVAARVYNETVVIRKSMTLLGEDRETTVIDGGGVEAVVKIPASYVIVSGFTIKNGARGVSTSGYFQRAINISKNIVTLNTELAIYLGYSRKNTVSDNVISLNGAGILLYRSNETAILRNEITKSGYFGSGYYSSYFGLWLAASRNNTLRNNRLSDNLYNFAMTGVLLLNYVQDIDTSNVIDDKPMLYLLNQHNVIIDSSTFPEVGYLAIINSTHIHVSDIHLTRNMQTFLIAYTNSSTVSNVVLSHNDLGIRLEGSHDNVISNCTFQGDTGMWIRWYSHGNDITSNVFANSSISLSGVDDNRVIGNIIENCSWVGVDLSSSHNNVIARNNVINNAQGGISLSASNGNVISDNTIENNGWYTFDTYEFIMGGLSLWESNTNIIRQNNISENRYGIITCQSNNNEIYHNNFTDNTYQLYDASWDPWYPGYPSTNTWDDGYPSGGNFWSNYTGVDLYSGVDQDQTGSDGIGDTPQLIDVYNWDRYPLMAPYSPLSVTWNGKTYPIEVSSNSTITEFSFNQSTKSISFKVGGPNGTTGFCNVTIPKELLDAALGEWIVLVDDTAPADLTISWNATHTFIYFIYTHSVHIVEIIGTQVVPESQPTMIPPLLMLLSLITVALAKRRVLGKHKPSQKLSFLTH